MTHTARRSWMGLVVAVLCLGISSPAVSGSSNSLMDLSDDGKLLACSNRDNGTVTIVDLSTRKKLREIPVGQVPEGVSFIGATHTLAVAVYRDDVVVFIPGHEIAIH